MSGFKSALVPVAVLAATLSASIARAQVTTITSAQLAATSTANFTDPVGAVADPYTVTATNSGPTMTYANNPAVNSLVRINQQGTGAGVNDNFAGDFMPGTRLLRNVATGDGITNALTITFSAPVSAFGFSFEPNGNYNPADFTFNVFQGNAAPTILGVAGVENDFLKNGSAEFFGVQATDGTNSITSVQIYAVASPGSGLSNAGDFVVSAAGVRVAPTVTPEPGALALLAGALLPMGLLAARRRRR